MARSKLGRVAFWSQKRQIHVEKKRCFEGDIYFFGNSEDFHLQSHEMSHGGRYVDVLQSTCICEYS